MTPDDPRHDQPARPDDEEVRRLLAALGAEPVPVPPQVSVRLDAALAELAAGGHAADTEGTDAAAPVSTLPQRERSRRWPQLLVAAAAVTVLGVGVGEVLEGSGPDAATTESAAGQAEAGDAAGTMRDSEEAQPYAATGSAAPDERQRDRREAADRSAVLQQAPTALTRLRSQSLTADVQRLVDFTVLDTAVREAPVPASGYAAGCGLPATERGAEVFAVRLDGEPALLLLHAAEAGQRLAEVFACDGTAGPVASTVVDAG